MAGHVVVGRYYDPSTGQFLSVDPFVDKTGMPYAYGGGDPVSNADPLGLANCSANPLSWTGCVQNAVGATEHFAHTHPTVGLALGITAAVAGTAALVVEAPVAASILGGSALLAGTAATIVDGYACVSHPGLNSQCVAAGLGVTGALASLPEFLVALGIVDEPYYAQYLALAVGGAVTTAVAALVDDLQQLYDDAAHAGTRPTPSGSQKQPPRPPCWLERLELQNT